METGKWAGTNVSKAFVVSEFGSATRSNLCEYFKDWAIHGGFFQFHEAVRGRKLMVTFTHELGKNGSHFLKGYAVSAFRNADIEIKVASITEGSISFEIPTET